MAATRGTVRDGVSFAEQVDGVGAWWEQQNSERMGTGIPGSHPAAWGVRIFWQSNVVTNLLWQKHSFLTNEVFVTKPLYSEWHKHPSTPRHVFVPSFSAVITLEWHHTHCGTRHSFLPANSIFSATPSYGGQHAVSPCFKRRMVRSCFLLCCYILPRFLPPFCYIFCEVFVYHAMLKTWRDGVYAERYGWRNSGNEANS